MAARNNRTTKKAQKKISLRLVLGLVAAGSLAYGGVYFKNKLPATTAKDESQSVATPWYKDHAKAPELIRLPDTPLILAAKEAEIDPLVKEIAPRKPLKPSSKPIEKPEPRLQSVDLAAKPQPPAPAVYEEALPQDIYTPTLPVIAPIEEETPPIIVEQVTKSQPRWMQYALQTEVPADKPMIALVIDDLGLDRKRTAQTLDLQGPMTMAFIPYSKHLDTQTAKARAQGHELLVHLPMEPLNDKVDAGPNNLNTRLAHEDLLERIHWNLERFSGYVGVNNHMGSKATTDEGVMQALMAELRNREMLFLDSRTNASSLGAKIATREGVPFAERNVFLDNVNDKAAVLKQLSLLENVSRKTGYAVGIGHPRDGTIAALKEWLPLAERKGFTLVPISRIVLKKQGLS